MKPQKLQLQRNIEEQYGGSDRPDSCPLKVKNIDILSKINNIKTFKDDCLDKDQSRLEEVLQGAESIKLNLIISKEKEEQKGE